MPQLNLSSLNGPELRRLLDSARRRGEAALSYQILQEMAARRDGDGERRRLFRMREPEEGRVVDLNLGDPLEAQDDIPPAPAWRPPPKFETIEAAPEPPEPAAAPKPGVQRPARRRKVAASAAPAAVVDDPLPPLDLKPPRGVWDMGSETAEDDADHAAGLRLAPPHIESAAAPRPRRFGLAAAFAVGAAAGVMAGWGFSTINRPAPVSTAAAAPIVTAQAQPVAAAPVLPVVAEPQPAPEPVAEAVPAALDTPEEASAPASEVGEARDVTGEALELPASPPKKVEVAEAPRVTVTRASATSDACAAAPTPADREICGDRALQRLQRELRQAYAEALDAHEDRARLRERQLAWRAARDEVSDPRRLARLYEQRIRKLNAATAEARQLR
jgi:uncharacterized protein YecT (DUF1311 family)